MSSSTVDIVRRLGENAEAVCRRYLGNGRREGHYWMVGNIHNERGRSLYVRLPSHHDGALSAGKWTDAESGDHGDLLDIIAASCGHASFRDTLEEARRFLSLPMEPPPARNPAPRKHPAGTPQAARRLWAGSKPVAGSLGQAYFLGRRILNAASADALRSHPNCYYRASEDDAVDCRPAWPAIIAAVTDDAGAITGVHRTWLNPAGGKAPVAFPRRAMGNLLGHGVRFGRAGPVMVFGEGLETLLSVREVLPTMPMIAGLSAAHLAAISFPDGLRRLYVARDNDDAGRLAFETIADRSSGADIELLPLDSELGDFNADLTTFGHDRVRNAIKAQLCRTDRLEQL